ncbi:unnamed protein product, partial [Heterosigma akashiwo]
PNGANVVGCRWVLAKKYDADSNLTKYKARLCAQGYLQIEGVDYTNTFSPVVSSASLRTVLAIAASEDMDIHCMDIKTAFLRGKLDEGIYMRQPEGYEVPGMEHKVLKLKRSLYGLKQAPKCWYQTVFIEGCHHLQGGETLISVYVDDIILASSDKSEHARIKKAISLGYNVSDMWEIESILGIKIQRDRAAKTITLSQHSFIEEARENFQVRSYEPVTNPINKGIDVNINTGTSRRLSTFEAKKFRSLVGTVNWLALWTFPEVAYSVHTLSKRFTSPSKNCLAASYLLLRYLWWTEDKSVTLG